MKRKSKQNDKVKLYKREMVKGENKGRTVGGVVGHAFSKCGGYLTGQDIIDLTNNKAYEELKRMGLITSYEVINRLSKEERRGMSSNDYRRYQKANTVYVATPALVKLYKELTESSAIFTRSGSLDHGLIQRQVFMSANQATRDTFINEKELEQMYKSMRKDLKSIVADRDSSQEERMVALSQVEHMNKLRREGNLQLVDFAYKVDGQIHFGEAVTSNYTSADLHAKVAFVEALGYNENQLTYYR